MEEALNVVFTIDERFVQHFSVTLVSLLENNKDITVNIYVIHNIKNLTTFNETKKFIYEVYNIKLNSITVDDSIFEKYKITHHISKAVYFRLLLVDILPGTIDKILYLDSDTIVTGSLKELLDLNFNDNFLLAVNDVELDITIHRLNKIGIPIKDYFNSGVMFINLELWRSENISKKL